MEKVSIEFPELDDKDQTTCYAQVRPQRKKGLRVEREVIGGKKIVHNYGHGGAGFSIGPSAANDAVEMARE